VSAGLTATILGSGLFGRAGVRAAPAPEGAVWRAAPLPGRLRPEAAQDADLWSLDARSAAPVLRLRQGEELRVRLVNDTTLPLSLHWQGVRGPNAMDGVGGLTQEPVPPGGSFEYRFLPPEPGTVLVRPCVLGGSAEPLERGLSAALVVEEASAPEVDLDWVVLVDDWLLGEDGRLLPFGAQDQALGRLGNVLVAGCRDHAAARQLGFVPAHGLGAALAMAQQRADRPPRIGFLLSPPYFPLRVAAA
jgi:FtsP/CotA-like multicopper oxidase with cupredoxin domain